MWSAKSLRDPQLKDIQAFEFTFEGIKVIADVNAGRQKWSAWRKCFSVLRQDADKLITRHGYNRDVLYKRIKGYNEFSVCIDLIVA